MSLHPNTARPQAASTHNVPAILEHPILTCQKIPVTSLEVQIDTYVIQSVKDSGNHPNWHQIAQKIFDIFSVHRKSKFIRERYMNILNPTLIHSPITSEEAVKIIEFVATYGKQWSTIGKELNRSGNKIKNYYNSLIRKLETQKINTQEENQETEQQQEQHSLSLSNEHIKESHSSENWDFQNMHFDQIQQKELNWDFLKNDIGAEDLSWL